MTDSSSRLPETKSGPGNRKLIIKRKQTQNTRHMPERGPRSPPARVQI